MKKLPKKYAGVLFSLYASAVMVLIVSGVLVALNTGIDAGYPLRLLKAYLITWPVAFASLLLVRELLGMTSYAVEYGYYRPERDLAWSLRIDPTAFTWEQFLRHSGWRGEAVSFGVAH